MKLIKNLLIFVLVIGVMLMGEGCERNIFGFKKGLLKTKSHSSETKRDIVYKDREEVEEDVRTYLSEKYGKEFVVAVSDSPNHIYSSYEVSAYAADDENKTFCTVTITYIDDENYSITDDYFMYSISGEFEEWFRELADPYIGCDFKVFWCAGFQQLSSDYDECKTAEDFLRLSPTASYYALRFLIVLPSQAADSDIKLMTDSIAAEMLERRIRGEASAVVYLDEEVYDLINTKKDESFFWSRSVMYKHIFCGSTIRGDFSFAEAII